MSLQAKTSTYTAFREKVRQALVLGQQKIDEARVRTYWETGRLINEYLGRAETSNQEHGKKVVANLAKDLGFGEKVFYRCMQFAGKFPTFAARRKLSWAHYRILMTIPDPKLRLEYTARADREAWSSPELQRKVLAEIREEKGTGYFLGKSSLSPLNPRRGTPGLFRVIRRKLLQTEGDELVIDLGFSVYLSAAEYAADDVRENDIVEFRQAGKNTIEFVKAKGKTEADLFTYRAFVERVVDGDTLRVKVMIGSGLSTRQYLRLRAIDCPELATKEGIKARDFVQFALQNTPEILITSSVSDKYDRYLADVFYNDKTGKEVFLNNLLLEEELAVSVRM